MVQRERGGCDAGAADQTVGRLDAGDAAQRRRPADRAAGIGADAAEDESRRNARAGLSPTAEQKDGLKAAYLHVAGMAERVRKPRGRMAEPVLTYGFAEEDLA